MTYLFGQTRPIYYSRFKGNDVITNVISRQSAFRIDFFDADI